MSYMRKIRKSIKRAIVEDYLVEYLLVLALLSLASAAGVATMASHHAFDVLQHLPTFGHILH